MKISTSLFQSKIGRQISILFVFCALFPVCALAFLSYHYVSKQLKLQTFEQLGKSAKAHGISVYERLNFLETDLKLIDARLWGKIELDVQDKEKEQSILNRTKAVAVISENGEIKNIYGRVDLPPDFLKQEVLNNGKTAITFHQSSESLTRVFMTIRPQVSKAQYGMIICEIDTSYLWGIGHENILPAMTGLCVLDQFRNVFVSSFTTSPELLHHVTFVEKDADSRWFEYTHEDDNFYVSYWPLSLEPKFASQNLTIVLRRAKSSVFAPLSYFKMVFPFVILLSLWVVLLISLVYIRKSLVPLETLKKGTVNVSDRKFDSRVTITSGNEFDDLAVSFNSMTSKLGQDFNALIQRSNIDRAVLSSFRRDKVIETALKRIASFFESAVTSIGLIGSKQSDSIRTYIYQNNEADTVTEEYLKLSSDDFQQIKDNPDHLFISTITDSPSYLSSAQMEGMTSTLVLPLFLEKTLTGVIAITHQKNRSYGEDDLDHARQLADQVSAALSNAYLVEDMDALNWGTLVALARTVDAKSKWTVGHSERVADIAVKIASAMGCDQKEIDAIHRAAYLHDIGQIGIPLSILDKPNQIDEQEYEIIKDHPAIGAQILEPIEAYSDSIPMVMQHHERFDGGGYPEGLVGESISLGARILAVADVFDAVVSDRPYRQGWVENKALDLITENAGKDFDPKVVEAFLSTFS